MRLSALLLALTLCVTAGACSRSDVDVQADLQKQLAADPATAGLTATVTDGVAKLNGITKTKAQQDRALDIARSVKGVKEVQSMLRMDDATLADEVKRTIAADASVSAIPLRIEVHEGEVKLFSDKTNSEQRAKLVQIAGTVFGVTHVEDNMK